MKSMNFFATKKPSVRRYGISSLSIITLGLLTWTSCTVDPNNPSPSPGGPALVVHTEQTFGWGKGYENNDGYLSLSAGNGQIKSYRTIDINDEATQTLVDVVFPGDWGSAGGRLTICSPSEGGAGGAGYEVCKEWIRRKGTTFVFLSPGSFQKGDFDKTTTVAQVQDIFANNSTGTWDLGTLEHSSFAIKTFEGVYAIAYVTSVKGTYGDNHSSISMIIKVQSK